MQFTAHALVNSPALRKSCPISDVPSRQGREDAGRRKCHLMKGENVLPTLVKVQVS